MGIDKVSLHSRQTAGSLPAFRTKSVIAGVAAAIAAGISLPSTAAGIELGEGLSVTGFLDMSYYTNDTDGSPTFDSAGIDQFEMDFMYEGSGGVSAQVDIEYGESSAGDPDDDTTFVEQAFITKTFTDEFSIKVGRFLSYSGWETEEPTGLFQYSGVGYAPAFYGYYQQGVSAAYSSGMFGVTASVVNSVFDPLDRDTGEISYELGLSLMPMEGLTAKVFFLSEKVDALDDETTVINAWVSYAMSGFTFAAEYNTADYADGGDGDGFLLMANYASGPWGITARYHDWDIDTALSSVTGEVSGFTISPSYKVGDNLLLVAEYRMDDLGGGVDSNSIALEALFTF
jgi:hypothetical protein